MIISMSLTPLIVMSLSLTNSKEYADDRFITVDK